MGIVPSVDNLHFYIKQKPTLMKKILTFLFALALSSFCLAQKATPDWTKKFPGNVKWYKVSDAGILVVGTGDALYGINPESGTEIWKLENLDDVKEENYDPIEGSPYIAIVKGGLFKKTHTVIDVTNGKIIANTKEMGMMTVTKRLELPALSALLLYGVNKTGKPSLTMVSYNDGAVKWEQNKLFEKASEQIVSRAGVVADGILLATNKNIYKLSPTTGEVLWSVDMKSDLPVVAPPKKAGGPLASLKGITSAFGDQGAGEQATSTSADFFQKDNKNLVYFWNQDVLTAFDVATGKEAWKRIELKSPITQILFDTRGMLVTTAEKKQEDIAKANKGGGGLIGKIKSSSAAGKNRAELLCLDPATGNQLWSDEVDLQGDVVAYKKTGDKLILATERDQGTNYISIVDLAAGKSITKKALKINGEARDLQLVPQGLYYRTSEEINILDLATGEKTWKKGFKVKNCVGENASDKLGYVYANDKIYKVDFEKGELTDWVTGINFNGGEDPSSLQVRPGGILITSAQNMSLYDYDGKLAWHTFQQAPGRTMAGKIFSGLGGLASAAVSAGSMANSAQLSYSKGYYGSTDPAVDRQIKTSDAMAGAFGNAAIGSFKSISKRFSATKEADNYMSMMMSVGGTNNAKDAGLVIMDKNNGKPGRQMLLGDKKDPDYQLDELGKMVFYKSDNNEIQGFKY